MPQFTDLFGLPVLSDRCATIHVREKRSGNNQIVKDALLEIEEGIGKKNWKLKVRPTYMVATYAGRGKKSLNQWRKPPVRTDHTGTLSDNAVRKLRNSVKWLVAVSPVKRNKSKALSRKVGRDAKYHSPLFNWKINIGTLTFRDNYQDDKTARFILSKFWEIAKYRWNVKHYVWKAEPQERGAIHFHFITNVYIPHKELCFVWNRLLYRHGLNQLGNNSTDIQPVISAKNLEAYLTDYLTNESKHSGRRSITGRLWGCSHALSQAGSEFIAIDKDELVVISDEFKEYDLGLKCSKNNKPIPKFLTYTGVWLLPEAFYDSLPDCPLLKLWQIEFGKLAPARALEFWPIGSAP